MLPQIQQSVAQYQKLSPSIHIHCHWLQAEQTTKTNQYETTVPKNYLIRKLKEELITFLEEPPPPKKIGHGRLQS